MLRELYEGVFQKLLDNMCVKCDDLTPKQRDGLYRRAMQNVNDSLTDQVDVNDR